MKIERIPGKPLPTPPDTIQVTLTLKEAQLLREVVGNTSTADWMEKAPTASRNVVDGLLMGLYDWLCRAC